ncbi:MAG: hypothetical protein IPN93_15905 [Bacteroidetes bacterium]|nr:hypothetical protein [Bacteroidota bacterium]
MRNSKLIEILATLTEVEIIEFKKFIGELCKNKDSAILKLFHLLEKSYPKFQEEDIQKKILFKKIFKGEAYNENKISKLMSELVKLIDQFVLERLSPIDQLSEKLSLMRFYFNKNLLKIFESHKRDFMDLIETSFEGAKKNYHLYQYEELAVLGELKINNRVANYNGVYRQLHDFYFAEKLRWENLAMINLQPNLELEDPKSAYYKVHYNLNKLLKSNSEQDFSLLFEEMGTFKGKIIEEELSELFIILLNFTIQKIAEGKIAYYHNCAAIFEEMIESNVFVSVDGLLKMSTYKNYITVLIRIGKLDKAIQFLEEYKSYLAPEIMEETYLFNKALLQFEKGDFYLVLDILNKIKPNDIFYKINQKRLMIKTFYELQRVNTTYFDILYNQLNAFKKYIYTEKSLPEINIEMHKNFIKTLFKIMGISKGENKKLDFRIRNWKIEKYCRDKLVIRKVGRIAK